MAYKTQGNLSVAKDMQKQGIDRTGVYIAADTAIGFDPIHLSRLMAMDASTAPNTATPAELTTYFDPNVIQVAFAPCRAEMLGAIKMVGDWTTTNYKFQVLEQAGTVRPYSDYSKDATIQLNDNFENRDFYNMEQVVEYGDKEVAIKATTFVDWVSQKRTAVAEAFKIELNKIFFGGVMGKQTYGILTDPNRIAATAATAGAGGGATWESKTGAEIVSDIRKVLGNLIKQSGEIVTGEEPMVMALPTEVINTLHGKLPETQATFQTVYQWIRNEFPNIEIVGVPQYATAGGNIVDIMLREYSGNRPIDLIVSERYRSHGIVKEISYQSEKISASTAGAVINRPWMISSMIGI